MPQKREGWLSQLAITVIGGVLSGLIIFLIVGNQNAQGVIPPDDGIVIEPVVTMSTSVPPTQVQSVSARCPGRDIFPLVPSSGKANYAPALHWLERVSVDAIKFGYYDKDGYVVDEETLSLSRLARGRWMSVHEFGQSEYGYVLCLEDLQTVYWATDYLWNFPEVN